MAPNPEFHDQPTADDDRFATTRQAGDPAAPLLFKLRSNRLPLIFGRYELLQRLGEGSMGEVYLARDTQLERHVAIKIPKLGDDRRAIKRFQREARAMATLRHANLCPIYDVGEVEGIPYLTMAYIEGKTLAAHLEEGKAFPGREVALLVMKLAQALDEAHQRGVIHRDVKPANIIVDQHKEPIVTDFGLAQVTSSEATLTRSGFMIGTPAYMSPEQAQGELDKIGPASDVYSLGAIMYQMLTGRLAFEGSFVTYIEQTVSTVPECPSTVEEHVPSELAAICLKALAKQPRERYASGGEFAAALRGYLKSASRVRSTEHHAKAGAERESEYAQQIDLARQLWQQGDYAQALPILERLANMPEANTCDDDTTAAYAKWARQELPKVRSRIGGQTTRQQPATSMSLAPVPYRTSSVRRRAREAEQPIPRWLVWIMALPVLVVVFLIALVLAGSLNDPARNPVVAQVAPKNRNATRDESADEQESPVIANQPSPESEAATQAAAFSEDIVPEAPRRQEGDVSAPKIDESETEVASPSSVVTSASPSTDDDGRPRRPPPPSSEQILRDLDRNGDGKLSLDEIPRHEQHHLMRADTNDDGVVDYDELDAFHDEFRPPPPNRPRRRRPPGNRKQP